MIKTGIGIVQFDILTGQTEKNIETAIKGIKKLAADGVRIVVLPEMFSCSFDNNHLEEHSRKTPEILGIFEELAFSEGVIIAGSMPENEDGRIYNTLYLIESSGDLAGQYRKVHLFSPTDEERFFSQGDRPVVCETSAGRIGLMTCYDLRFPELCRYLAINGAEIVVVSAQWPSARIEHWDTLLKARAIENQIFIAAANRCGRTTDLVFPGHSRIISPWGALLAKADESESVISAEVSPSEIERARAAIPCLEERRPEVYE